MKLVSTNDKVKLWLVLNNIEHLIEHKPNQIDDQIQAITGWEQVSKMAALVSCLIYFRAVF